MVATQHGYIALYRSGELERRVQNLEAIAPLFYSSALSHDTDGFSMVYCVK